MVVPFMPAMLIGKWKVAFRTWRFGVDLCSVRWDCGTTSSTITLIPARSCCRSSQLTSTPCIFPGVASDDEESQAWVAGIYGTYYALGTTAGPLIAGALMQLELPFLCRPGDWPVDVNASQTTLLPHPTPSLSTSQPSNAGDGKQHCFDGTFTLLCLVLSAYCVVYFVHMCVTLSNMKRT